ncbi:MAG: hypothetical protein AAGA70_07005 [Pseudomonadota bacterium]
MDVILHFGVHRTATTTFQRMLGQSGPVLRAQGCVYWGPKRTRSDLFEGLLGSAERSFPWGGTRPSPSGRVERALSGLADEGAKKLLVSEENMVGTMGQALAKTSLYPDVAARAARLATTFGPFCRRVALGIRSYDAWWASVLAFCVARSGPVPSRLLAAELAAQKRRWRHVIEEIAAAFPASEVVVWTHEVMSARPEIAARGLLGDDLPRLSGIRDWHNASPTPAAIRRHLADLGESDAGVIETMGRFMPFDGSERRVLQAAYAEDIAWLRAGPGGRIRYIDDLDTDPIAAGVRRGQSDAEGQDRRVG